VLATYTNSSNSLNSKPGTHKKSFLISLIRPSRALSELQYTFTCLKPKQQLYNPKRTKEKMQPQKMPSALMQKGTTLQLVATLQLLRDTSRLYMLCIDAVLCISPLWLQYGMFQILCSILLNAVPSSWSSGHANFHRAAPCRKTEANVTSQLRNKLQTLLEGNYHV